MLTDTDILSGSAGGTPSRNSVVLEMLLAYLPANLGIVVAWSMVS